MCVGDVSNYQKYFSGESATVWNEYTPFNDGWYTLTGGWTVDDGNDIYDYNHNRTIIYGFEAPEV